MGRSQWEGVALATGVPFKTIQRIAYDSDSNPTVQNFLPLLKYLQSRVAA